MPKNIRRYLVKKGIWMQHWFPYHFLIFVVSLSAPTPLCRFGRLGSSWYGTASWPGIQPLWKEFCEKELWEGLLGFVPILLECCICSLPLPDLYCSSACAWPHTSLIQTPTGGLNCLLWLWTCIGITDSSSSLDSCFWLLPLELLCSSFLGTASLCPCWWSLCLPCYLAPLCYAAPSPCCSPLVASRFLEPRAKHCGAWLLGFTKFFLHLTVCAQGPDRDPKSLTKQVITFTAM